MSDNNSRFDLTRRKALAGLGGIGAGAAIGGTGTMAFLNDSETTSAGITAGELDIQLDWRTVYNGEERSHQETPVDTNSENQPILTLDDVKPGDDGCIVISIHNDTNPAWIWHQMRLSNRDDNGLTDPEAAAGDTTSGDGEGELQEFLEIRAFYDDNFDCEWNVEEECALTAWRKLTDYLSMETFAGGGILLDGLRGTSVYNRQDAEEGVPGKDLNLSPFFPTPAGADAEFDRWYGTTFSSSYSQALLDAQTGTQYVTYQWRLPESVGNEIQGDSVDITIEFYAQQARHNGFPENPFVGGDPDFSVDLAPGVDPDGDGYFEG